MTDETPELPAESPAAEPQAPKKTARKRKVAKPEMSAGEGAGEPSPAPPAAETKPEPAPSESAPEAAPAEARPAPVSNVRRISSKPGEAAEVSTDGGEEDGPVIGEPPASAEAGAGGKRRRRRRRRGGAEEPETPEPVARPRVALDREEVASKAWKIFKAEVGEEGLALVDDHDARELSRRSFRLAEIFLEEAARRQ